jgi:tRNA(Ile)-lysidine synthase
MASSRKSKPSKPVSTDLVSRVSNNIRDVVKSGERLVVGLSGGVDSIVLLDVLRRIANRRRFALAALHVNHQISPNAGRWAAFCRTTCRARGIPLRVVRVNVEGGDSLEAAARAARYDALFSQKADYVALAHHQDDQAETVLLQLLRGAGVKGLAAMPLVRRDEGGGSRAEGKTRTKGHPPSLIPHPLIVRPLLDVPRAQIEAYARKRKLAWIEDESNTDVYFLRNFMRREVLPLLNSRFPAYRTTLARSARHFAEASKLLDELAALDGVGYLGNGALRVAGLRKLSRARARNLMRHFLAGRGVIMPNAERLEEALRQSLTAREDTAVCIDLGDCELRRFAGALHVVNKMPGPDAEFSRRWSGERELALPELGGVLSMRKGRGAGISLARLQVKPVSIRVRGGGERLQPDCRRPRRSLKNLLQEAAVAPWRRERVPLLFCGDILVWVPGVGIDCEFQAEAGEISVAPEWKAE